MTPRAGSADALHLVTLREGAVRLEVHASPRARASRITGVREGALAVRLAAPPVDGAANEELVELIASAVGLPRRDVSVVRGQTSRGKLVELRGLSPQEIRDRLATKLGAEG